MTTPSFSDSVDRPDWRGREITVDGITSRWGWNPADEDAVLTGSHAPMQLFSVKDDHPSQYCQGDCKMFDAMRWTPGTPIIRFTRFGLIVKGDFDDEAYARTEVGEGLRP
jgi:hypothetical protein